MILLMKKKTKLDSKFRREGYKGQGGEKRSWEKNLGNVIGALDGTKFFDRKWRGIASHIEVEHRTGDSNQNKETTKKA